MGKKETLRVGDKTAYQEGNSFIRVTFLCLFVNLKDREGEKNSDSASCQQLPLTLQPVPMWMQLQAVCCALDDMLQVSPFNSLSPSDGHYYFCLISKMLRKVEEFVQDHTADLIRTMLF